MVLKKLAVYCFVCFLMGHVLNTHAQEIPFEMMQSKGSAPGYFTSSVSNKLSDQHSPISPYKPRKQRLAQKEFYVSGNFWINDLLKSGDVLYGEESHVYLTALLKNILDANGIPGPVYIHGVKSPAFNAFACDQGLIFVNVGLLGRVKNEAELAFVICHELAHYTQHHNLEGHLREFQVETQKNNKTLTTYEKVVKKHSYSRVMETRADSIGMIYYARAGYSYEHAVNVFDLMLDENSGYEGYDFNGLLDFSQLSNYVSDSEVAAFRKKISDKFTANDADTNLLTHPEPLRRKQRMQKSINSNSTGREYIVSESQFKSLKTQSINEISRLYYLELDFSNSLLYASIYNKQTGRQQSISNTLLPLTMLHVSIYPNRWAKSYSFKEFLSVLNPAFSKLLPYLYFMPDSIVVQEISSRINQSLENKPAKPELVKLNNGYLTWINNHLLSTAPQNFPAAKNYKSPLQNREQVTAASNSNKTFFLDPTYLVFDLREQYSLKYQESERNRERIVAKVKSMDRKKDKFSFLSINQKTSDATMYNARSIVMARMQEIVLYDEGDLPMFCSWDESALAAVCNRYQACNAVYSLFAVGKVSRSMNTVKMIMYCTVLCPLPAMIDAVPIVRGFSEHYYFNLNEGVLISKTEEQALGDFNTEIALKRVYFK